MTKTQDKTRGKVPEAPVCKKQECLPTAVDYYGTSITAVKKDNNQPITPLVRPPLILSSSQPTAVSIGPSMSDLDSDSDELYLPAVSEAIRMLDLDSQRSPASQNTTGPSHSASTSGHPSLPINLASNVSGSAWPSVGYCSSLLQQFVAKSQSGEPPPPPPTLMLPTKGARKCFPPNDDPLPLPTFTSALDPKSIKRATDTTKPSCFTAITSATLHSSVSVGHADQELDMMVPMRGLDCHPSHVSPDSGIQSVSGSPFSVHSSPVHPSGAGNNQTNGQSQPLVASPCPQITSPSPPLRQKQTSKKSNGNQKNSAARSKDVSPQATTKVKNSSSRQNGSRGRRPRSCRDTASALSSGLGKDSSIVQAIQRGMNAALRLKNKDATEKEISCPTEVVATNVLPLMPSKSSRKKKSGRNQQKIANSQALESIKTADSSTFGVEVTSQLHSLTAKGSEVETSPAMSHPQQPKLKCELKATAARSPSPQIRNKKRKKKRKKQKSSVHDQVFLAPVDPNLQSNLELLCRRLDRCVISRSVAQNGSLSSDVRPWIFQCRKYIVVNGNISGSGRTKRKKVVEDIAIQPNVQTIVTKRKGKAKKTGLQSPPVAAISNIETSKEDEPSAATSAASVVLSTVELLLPLKKRHHHHLATSTETPVVEPVPANLHQSEAAIGKPSHEQVLIKAGQHQVNSRKRAANSESVATVETTESVGFDREVESKVHLALNPKNKKGRCSKKAKTDSKMDAKMADIAEIIDAVAAAPVNHDHEDMETQMNSSTIPTPTPVIQGENDVIGDQVAKKKQRRRKTFNRTGFPSVKKKRKKPPSPIPPPPVSQPLFNKDEIDQSACHSTTARQAKRAKLMPSKDDDDDGLLPEPTSSEAPSGDESNPILPLPTNKSLQPKKRRMSTVRKRYLPAGLLSNYFKESPESSSSAISVSTDRTKLLTYEPEEHEHGLLPPPFYCERILRRTKRDFQLPFDVWWLHQQGKLPDRDNLVPSWNYRKIRSNVYYDVKPPFTNDAEACNCTLPQPEDEGSDFLLLFFKIIII